VLTSTEQIKEKLDIVELIQGYIQLTKAGVNFKACCPFHNEKTASLVISPEKQIWHCFGCGLGGDVFNFVMQIEGVEFKDALRILADKAGVKLSRQDPKLISEKGILEKVLYEASLYFQNQLINNQEGKLALDYLTKERGISKQMIEKFSVGYAPNQWRALTDYLASQGIKKEDAVRAGMAYEKNDQKGAFIDRFRGRIMFPMTSQQGRIVGFGGRVFEPAYRGQDISNFGKYINTPQTILYNKSFVLYGLDKAKTAIRRLDKCVVVEGQMDVIASHQAGVENVVASSGTALTEWQLKIIKRLASQLVLAFDMDTAGMEAAKKGIDLALKLGYNIKVVTGLQGKDAAEAVKTDPQIWQKAVNEATDVMSFYFNLAFKDCDLKNIENKKRIAAKLLPVISRISNGIERSHYLHKLSDKLDVDERVLENAISKTQSHLQTEVVEENNFGISKQTKSKRELLEEYVLSFLISGKFNDFSFFANRNFDSSIFKNLEYRKIAEKILFLLEQKDKVSQKKLEELSTDEKTKKALDRLALLEDNFSEDSIGDFKKSVKELEILYFRNILRSIGSDIKEAESKNDKDTLKILIEEFEKFSKKLIDIEKKEF